MMTKKGVCVCVCVSRHVYSCPSIYDEVRMKVSLDRHRYTRRPRRKASVHYSKRSSKKQEREKERLLDSSQSYNWKSDVHKERGRIVKHKVLKTRGR